MVHMNICFQVILPLILWMELKHATEWNYGRGGKEEEKKKGVGIVVVKESQKVKTRNGHSWKIFSYLG